MYYYPMLLLWQFISELGLVNDKTVMMALEEEEVRLCDLQTLTLLWWLVPNDCDSIKVYVFWLEWLGRYDIGIEISCLMNMRSC